VEAAGVDVPVVGVVGEETVSIWRAPEGGDRTLREIPLPRVDVLAFHASTPAPEAVRRFVESGHTRAPVYEGDAGLDGVIGIVHVLEETIQCHKVVKIFGGQQYESERFARAAQQHRGFQMRYVIPEALTTPVTHILASVALAVIVYIAMQGSLAERATVEADLAMLATLATPADLEAADPPGPPERIGHPRLPRGVCAGTHRPPGPRDGAQRPSGGHCAFGRPAPV